MSRSFDALCYIRLFSDVQPTVIDDQTWRYIALRDQSGYNIVSKRIYFDLVDLSECLLLLCDICKDYIEQGIGHDHMCELYVWIRDGLSIRKLNNVTISVGLSEALASLKIELICSVEELFPDYTGINMSCFPEETVRSAGH